MNACRMIIAGSRGFTDYERLCEMMAGLKHLGHSPSLIISGTAEGGDLLGERWAKANGIYVHRMPAEWGTYGRSAGYRRNVEMANCADVLVALWDAAHDERHV